MEIVYFVLGIVTVLLISGGVVIFKISNSLNKLKDKSNDIANLHKDLVNTLNDINDVLHRRIDDEIRMVQSNINENERDILSLLDSRLDKLENRITTKIPPTNEDVLRELKQLKEEFLTLRRNL